MELNRLRELLEKYWETETTVSEEAELADLLSSPELPPEFRKEADVFNYFREQKTRQLSSEKSSHMLQSLDSKPSKSGKVVRMAWNGLKVAAVVVVIFTAGWLVRNEIRESPEPLQPITDTFEDPNQAFEETKKALQMIGKNLSKGRNQAARFKAFNEAQEKAKNLGNEKEEEKL